MAAFSILRGETHGIELVVSHHSQRIARVCHSLNGFEYLQNLGTAVDEVAEENDLSAFRVSVCPAGALITELRQQSDEFVMLPVNVGYDIVFWEMHLKTKRSANSRKNPQQLTPGPTCAFRHRFRGWMGA
jgi:hypothetical protein